jgi:hypothetical protein
MAPRLSKVEAKVQRPVKLMLSFGAAPRSPLPCLPTLLLWQVTSSLFFSPQISLIFSFCQVYFILSGEGEFSEQGAEHDFRHFYNTRVNLLTKESRKKGERFQELISYFNHELFPEASDGNSQDDMDDEEKELDKAIEEESEESPAEEEA